MYGQNTEDRLVAILGIMAALVATLRETGVLDPDVWISQLAQARTMIAARDNPDELDAYDVLLGQFVHF